MSIEEDGAEAALRTHIIERIDESKPVQEILGEDGDAIPKQMVQNPDGFSGVDPDEVDPRITVSTSDTGSGRDNLHVEYDLQARVIVDGTSAFVRQNGTRELKRLKGLVKRTLLEHRNGWGATGIDEDEDIDWEENINRYMGVVAFGFETGGVFKPVERQE